MTLLPGKDMQAEKDRFQRKLEKLALSNVMSNTTPTKGPSGTRSMEDQRRSRLAYLVPALNTSFQSRRKSILA